MNKGVPVKTPQTKSETTEAEIEARVNAELDARIDALECRQLDRKIEKAGFARGDAAGSYAWGGPATKLQAWPDTELSSTKSPDLPFYGLQVLPDDVVEVRYGGRILTMPWVKLSPEAAAVRPSLQVGLVVQNGLVALGAAEGAKASIEADRRRHAELIAELARRDAELVVQEEKAAARVEEAMKSVDELFVDRPAEFRRNAVLLVHRLEAARRGNNDSRPLGTYGGISDEEIQRFLASAAPRAPEETRAADLSNARAFRMGSNGVDALPTSTSR